MPLSREQKKWSAKRRAEIALKHAWERIDWMEDVIQPELEKMQEGTKRVSGENAQKALEEVNEAD